MGRWLRWFATAVGIIFGLLIVIPGLIIAVFALFYEWDDARPLIGRVASSALGRQVTITDALHVDLGRVTRIEMRGLTIANAVGGKAPHLLRIGDLDLSVALRPLLSGNVVLPEVRLADIDAALERNRKGEANWELASGGKSAEPEPSGKPGRLPLIESLKVRGATIRFDDEKLDKHATFAIHTLNAGENQQRTQMTAEGDGAYQGRPASLKALMGSLTVLREAKEPYPVDVSLVAGDFQTRIDGTMADPLAVEGLDLNLDVSGDDLSNLYPITGIPIPPSPPYRLTGRLERKGNAFVFKNFAGLLGSSDMRGTVSADLSGARPRIEGDVTSKLLDLKDLAGFIGASEGGANPPPKPDTGRVLPDTDVDLSKLRAVDAKIAFKGTRINTPQVPIDRMEAKVSLDNGTFRAQPVSFAVGQGELRVFFSLYGGSDPVHSDVDAVISNVDLKRLLQGTAMGDEMAGSFNGRIKLTSNGTSIADIAGSATGETMIVLAGGRFSSLLVELIGLDIAESLGFLVEGDRPQPIRCVVADLAAEQGVFDVRTLVFDTTDTNVVGTGKINMRDETLDLRLRAYPKDFSPFTLRTPLSVQGTFASPQAFPDPAHIGVESTAQKILNGILTVLTGVLPPVDVGPGKDAPCDQLIKQVREKLKSDGAPASKGKPQQ
ncbi:MAG: AsmA family protein [Rhodospirillales bacterium]